MVTRLMDMWESSLVAFLCALAACLYLLWLAVVLSIVDIRTHTLPNRYVLPAYPIAGVLLLVAALAAGNPQHVLSAVGGAAALAALYWLLWFAYPAGMGFGDVKLAGVLGLFLGFLGWQHVLLGAAAGFIVGGLWGLALIVSGRGTAKSAIPFGPSMLAGALATMLLLPG
ncbi:A24 family peptidase [Arthrobacter sp. E3]|uniref:prepilin peptidase n=1 Tax=Arthrobacter sp. E3 TaxID=517402 RepID=UPI001A93F341|nr:A24 family peptidase [Arthrobacter sp. E3]